MLTFSKRAHSQLSCCRADLKQVLCFYWPMIRLLANPYLQVTEDSMQSDLINYVSEPLLANLCTMYELMDHSGSGGFGDKTKLLTLIGGILPDDFDASFMHAK